MTIAKNITTSISLTVLFFFSMSWGGGLFAQNNMGIGTLTPNPSALLDLKASNKGLLIPRIVDTNNIVSPATGLLIYLVPTNNFYYFNGTYWNAA